MARGWESKAVEEQISAREAEIQKSGEQIVTPGELKRRAKREGLLLVRNRASNLLQSATNERYRQILRHTLAHIDDQLAQLELEQQ